jgi:ubiquinone/menaquinone biosynthesis C-methylase UbiE
VEIAKSKNLPRTKCIRANAEKLPFDNEYVDRYVSNLVLEIVEDPVAMMMDAYRVLTTEGILALSVFGRHGTCNQMLVQNRILTLARLPKAVIFTKPINMTWDLENPLILKDLAKEAGFSKTFTYYEQYHYPYENVKDLKNFFLDSPFLREPAMKENRMKDLEDAIDTELNRLLEEEETPLNFEALVLIANKN